MARIHGMFWTFVSVLGLALAGCGGGNAPQTSKGPDASGVPASASPDQVVAEFLKALQEGNETVAGALLTTRARAETERNGLVVQPPGSAEAKFSVGQAQVNGAAAKVNSVWSEPDATGSVRSFDVEWMLGHEDGIGWRISGMATPLEGQVVYLNFEEPLDMLRRMEQESGAAASVANQPEDPNGRIR